MPYLGRALLKVMKMPSGVAREKVRPVCPGLLAFCMGAPIVYQIQNFVPTVVSRLIA